MTGPSFSICIPNYNYGRYIGQTIQSVLDQTYQEFEIVVADNCSTDDSVAVVESFKSDKIRLIRNRWNIGYAPNLQRATESARNDYLMVLPSDDMMRPTALETYAAVLEELSEEAPRSLLFSDVEVVDDAGRVIYAVGKGPGSFEIARLPLNGWASAEEGRVRWERYRGLEVLREIIVPLTVPGPFPTLVCPRELHRAVEGFSSTHRVSPDAHFMQKLLFLDPAVIYVKRPLLACRQHERTYVGRAAATASIDLPLDHYLLIQEYRDEQLRACGRTREELVRAFVDRFCVRPAAALLAEGHRLWAFKHVALGFATYPRQMLRDWQTWGLAPLLGLGPVGSAVARLLRGAYRSRREESDAR